jgi:four helix bundle protein
MPEAEYRTPVWGIGEGTAAMTDSHVDGLRTFEDLRVWQKAHALVLVVYRCTSEFPSEERYGLVSQMRRAAVSVPANIAEGFKKRGLRDKRHFYNIAQGSLEELRYYFILSRDLGYVADTTAERRDLDDVARMLHGLAESTGRRESGTRAS